MPTVARILELAPTCCYLASNYKDRQGLFNAKAKSTLNQSTLIYGYWKILNEIYTLDSDYPGLVGPANYLWELCQKFGFKAASIVDGGGGGQVAPVTPASSLEQLNFTVAASGTTLIDGQSTVNLNQFIGYNLLVNKNGTPLAQIVSAPVHYTWDKQTGDLTVVPAAFLGDEFQITPA